MAIPSLRRRRYLAPLLAALAVSTMIVMIDPRIAAADTASSRSADSPGRASISQQRATVRLSLKGLPKTMPLKKNRRFQVRVINQGPAVVRGVRVTITASRGLVLRPAKRSFNRLRPGTGVTINVSVRANRRAQARGRVVVNVAARHAGKARLAKTLGIRRPGAGQKTLPSTGPVKSPAGHYFWALEPARADRSSDAIGFYFSNDRFVHVGLPDGGLPNCTRANAKRDSDGNIESGCVRYTFNPRNGVIRIDKMRGKFIAKRGRSSVQFDDKSYYLATIPKAGTRIQATLTHRGFRGYCGLILGCSTWKENLGLDRRGRFVRSRSRITSIGGGGVPFVWGANFPPDEHGTYRILSRGRIQFRYKDGTVSTETIAIHHNDRGRPDPVNEGINLDSTWYYLEED